MIIKTTVHTAQVHKNMKGLQAMLEVEMPKIHEKLCEIVRDRAKLLCPVYTGVRPPTKVAVLPQRLRDSIHVEQLYRTPFSMKSRIGSKHPYAMNVEIGGPVNIPRHYLRNAISQTKKEREEYFKGEVNRILGSYSMPTGRVGKMGAPSLRSIAYKTARILGHIEAVTGAQMFPRSILYSYGKLSGDVSAFEKGVVLGRTKRRILGKISGRVIGRISPPGKAKVPRRAVRIAGARVSRKVIF